jgi:2-oxoglutarate ferredoxin oxidoreductase subunit alpha
MKEFLQTNVAVVKSAINNGLNIFFGYPITPSTEALEYAAEVLSPEKFMNSFSELETINLMYGAGAAGKRNMTATSGCGFSLMREGLSYMIGAKVPGVIYNVMRFSPGLGGLSPSNQDINVYWGVGHGQSKVPILTPSSGQEAADAMMYAFDMADTLRLPVIVTVDTVLGQLYEPVEIHKSDFKINKDWAVGQNKRHVITSRKTDQRKVIQSYKTYDSEQAEHIDFILEREKNMLSICKTFISETVKFKHTDSGEYLAAIGTCARVIQEVAEKTNMGYIIPLLLNPFEFKDKDKVKSITVVEMGGTALYDIIKYNFPDAKVKSVVFSHLIPDVEEIMERLSC